jgi:hypothetical protein
MDALRWQLERAEFDALDTVVRFHAGRATTRQVAHATLKVKALRRRAADLEQRGATGRLLPHPWRPAAISPAPGH